MEADTEEEMRQTEERKANTPRGRAKRKALVAAMELKDYDFNAHGVTCRPVHHVHAHHRHRRRGVGERPKKELGVPINTVIIGPSREVTDIYYDWARIREVDEDGVLLVRPDKHIGWRSPPPRRPGTSPHPPPQPIAPT